jgi:hypothetical protein
LVTQVKQGALQILQGLEEERRSEGTRRRRREGKKRGEQRGPMEEF